MYLDKVPSFLSQKRASHSYSTRDMKVGSRVSALLPPLHYTELQFRFTAEQDYDYVQEGGPGFQASHSHPGTCEQPPSKSPPGDYHWKSGRHPAEPCHPGDILRRLPEESRYREQQKSGRSEPSD